MNFKLGDYLVDSQEEKNKIIHSNHAKELWLDTIRPSILEKIIKNAPSCDLIISKKDLQVIEAKLEKEELLFEKKQEKEEQDFVVIQVNLTRGKFS
jgi:hypothetical protein